MAAAPAIMPSAIPPMACRQRAAVDAAAVAAPLLHQAAAGVGRAHVAGRARQPPRSPKSIYGYVS